MGVNRRKPEWRKITPFQGLDLLYGFKSRTSSGDQATLGQTPIDAAADFSKLVIAPNNCQPHSASKKGAAGSSGGLVSVDKIATIVTAGWRVKWGYPPRPRKATGDNKNIMIKLGTMKYGFIRAADTMYDKLAGFGHATPSATDFAELIYGAQFPQPPKMAIVDPTTGKSVSSYADNTKIDDIVAAGGKLIHPGAYTDVHLANMIATAT